MIFNKTYIDELKKQFPINSRIKLVSMNDTKAPPIGTQGVIKCIDDAGTIHVKWDNGSSLGIVLEAGDKITKIGGI